MKFTHLLKKIIVETADKIDFLIDTFTKPKKKKDGTKKKAKMSKPELFAIIKADPDTNLRGVELETASPEDLKKIKVGDNVNWLIRSFMNLNQMTEIPFGQGGYEDELKRIKGVFLEDLYKVSEDLKKYQRFKGKLPVEKRDINKITSPRELYDLVKDFDLTLATTTKSERKTAPSHPGANLIYQSDNLKVVEIKDKSALGKEAACFYGGNNKETRWCTSAPGLSHFDYYINKGPLYVIWNPNDTNIAPTTGLPVERYQLNFETDSYMDRHDHSIDLVEKLNGPWAELKQLFKPKFAKGLTTDGTKLEIKNLKSGNVGKFVSLYGLEELFESLPNSITELVIDNTDKNSEIIIEIPKSIKRFQKLEMIMLNNCIQSIPDEICELKCVNFISLIGNKKLTTIPECIADMPCLVFLNLKDSPVNVPEKIKSVGKEKFGKGFYDFHSRGQSPECGSCGQ